MPNSIEWHTPNRVIDACFWGKVTMDEVQHQSQRFVEMLAAGETHAPGKKLYLLYDTSGAESMPPLYLMLPQALPVLRFKNRGPMFHVTRNKTIRSIIELSAHVTQFQLYSFATREEAIHALETTMVKDDIQSG